MRILFITIITGLLAGIVDIAPMLKMKMDRHAVLSAFSHYFILPFIIFNINFYGLVWWLQGVIVSFLLALPTIVLVAKAEKKSIFPMTIMAIVLGTLVSAAGQFLL